MKLDRQTMLDLLAEGKAAFEAGDPPDACPYDRLRGGTEGQFGYRYWARGYSDARSGAESTRPPAKASTGH
ncbi:hypothetical protein ACIOFY_36580 [Streptomyces anulatus]